MDTKHKSDNTPIIIKNLGHIYLRYKLASSLLSNLFIEGAIKRD
jgi:hypothetical protein